MKFAKPTSGRTDVAESDQIVDGTYDEDLAIDTALASDDLEADDSPGVFGQEAWVATLDSSTCEECGALDGEIYDEGEGDEPPIHYNCRCIRVAIIDGGLIGDRPATSVTEDILDGLVGDERRAMVEELTGQVPATTTYQDWLADQSAEFQDEVLGPTRGAMFRDGMTIGDFVDANGDAMTIDELNGQGAGTLFASPNTAEGLNLQDAIKALSSAEQVDALAASQEFANLLNVEVTDASSTIGAWTHPDGAENSTIMQIAPGTSWEDLRALGSMQGLYGDQKAVLLFQEGKGSEYVADFKLTGKSLVEVNQSLIDNKVENFTLQKMSDGSVQVRLFGENTTAEMQKLSKLGDTYGTEVNVKYGKGEFLGSNLQKASDLKVRDDAAIKFEANLASQPQNIQDDWRTILSDHGRRTEEGSLRPTRPGEAPKAEFKGPPENGLKATGKKELKAVSNDWAARSPIKTIDDLYREAPQLKKELDAIGKEIADQTGAIYKPASLKKGPLPGQTAADNRVLTKLLTKTPAEISDIVRSSFIINSPEQADAVVRALAEHFPVMDENWRVTPVGYFDRPTKLILRNGQFGEVIIAPQELITAKGGGLITDLEKGALGPQPAGGDGHDLYEQWRKYTKDGTVNTTDTYAQRLASQQLKLYGAARDAMGAAWDDTINSATEGMKEMEANKAAIVEALSKVDPNSMEARVSSIIDQSVTGTAGRVAKAEALMKEGAATDSLVESGGFKIDTGEVDAKGKPITTWTPERQALHDNIINDLLTEAKMEAATPAEGEAPRLDMIGGRAGAGKSWFTDAERGGPIDKTKSFYVSSDDIREKLPGYAGWNSGLFHEEAGDITYDLVAKLREAKVNVIYDATMKTFPKIAKLIDEYTAAGYDVNGYFMSTTPETSAIRAMQRFKAGGRYVPIDVVLGSTTNEATFQKLESKFSKWSMYDNNADKFPAPPTLIRASDVAMMDSEIKTLQELEDAQVEQEKKDAVHALLKRLLDAKETIDATANVEAGGPSTADIVAAVT
jgi:predicted ABC-type ATPase